MTEAANASGRSVLLVRQQTRDTRFVRKWTQSGSGICVSPSLLVTCLHVVYAETAELSEPDSLSIQDAQRMRENVAVLDCDASWRTPGAIFYDKARDIAVLKFDPPLRTQPALCGIDFTLELVERLMRRSWHALGYPRTENGKLVPATLIDGLAVITGDAQGGCAMSLQIKGGLQPGFSGGALVWRDHPAQPVIGMPRMGGGEKSITAACTMDAVLHVMKAQRMWPSRIMSMADMLSPNEASAAADLDCRRSRVADLFADACATARERGLALAPIPHGRVLLPDGRMREVQRPVAIMCTPMSRGTLGIAAANEWDAGTRMATSLSRHQVEKMGQRMPCPSGGRWRLPTLAEWWMAVTAGQSRVPSSSTPAAIDGFSTDAEPENCWGIQLPPGGSLEWLAAEPGEPDSVIDPRGECSTAAATASVSNIGFRFVWDPLERAAS